MVGGLRRKIHIDEEVDPMQGTANLADAMLVFACGILLSLIMHWNVDIGSNADPIQMKQGQEITENQEVRNYLTKTEGKGQSYEKMGIVYKDPNTGKLFMLTDQ
jgi:hypothetical protein